MRSRPIPPAPAPSGSPANISAGEPVAKTPGVAAASFDRAETNDIERAVGFNARKPETRPRDAAPDGTRAGRGFRDNGASHANNDRRPGTSVAPEPPVDAPGSTDRPGSSRNAGSRKVRVSCRPLGLDLYVDGTRAVSDCSDASTAWIRPGVRKLVLKNPPGRNICPPSRPRFVEIPKGGRTTPEISVSTPCKTPCTQTVRAALRAGKASSADLACLSEIEPGHEDFLDARLLRAHAHVMQNELAEAERVLSTVIKTRRGRTDPEVRARLAEVLGRRKRLEEASREAETAWRYRMKFRGNRGRRETWTLNVLRLRAGLSEQLFYRDRNRAYFQRALQAYRELERSAARAGRNRMLQTAKGARVRLESQEAQLLGE